MTGKDSPAKHKFTPDWLVRGILTKIGDTVDRFTGRRWVPSSSIAASELVERIKKLLDIEGKQIPGRGTIVPHNIKLKMQWDKFSDDAESALKKLEIELLAATIDYINDSLYYTYAPVTLEVKPDYFVEGVKLFASFDKFTEDEREVEMNVTVPAFNVSGLIPDDARGQKIITETYLASFMVKDAPKEKKLSAPINGRISVGRTTENDLMIDDISVSKIHASLVVGVDGSLSVADTGSTNGTFVNDERIAYGKAVAFTDSDVIKFGTVPVRFEHQPRQAETPDVEAEADALQDEEVVEIGGFEFKRRESPDLPTEQSAPADKATAESVSEQPVSEQTVRIETAEKPEEMNKSAETVIEILKPIPPPSAGLTENKPTIPVLPKTSDNLTPTLPDIKTEASAAEHKPTPEPGGTD